LTTIAAKGRRRLPARRRPGGADPRAFEPAPFRPDIVDRALQRAIPLRRRFKTQSLHTDDEGHPT
jgi:hypothetical protein